ASNRTRVECQSPCELRVAEQAELGNDAYLGPAEGSDLGAADVELFVGGIKQDGKGKDKGAPVKDAVVVGAESSVRARVFAPSGTLWVKQESHGKGTFVASGIRVGHGTELEKEAPVVVEPDCAAYCELLVAAGCPAGPADEQQCASECEAALSAGFCQEQYEALVVCALTKKSVSCDEQGKPLWLGCEQAAQDLATCAELCAQADDANACTEDLCDCTLESCGPETAISHVPVAEGTPCPDADKCNGEETCDAQGACQPGVPVLVDDQNPCTIDTCDPPTGQVSHTPAPKGTLCPDGDVCNGDESCNGAGVCAAGTPLVVDDGNPCTIDACDPVTGVAHSPAPPGAPCPDADKCNGAETCNGQGSCLPGQPVPVDDQNPCTADSCNPASGEVTHTPLVQGTPCPDGNLCNGEESCDGAGVCVSGVPPLLDDQNPCTIDACDPLAGVTHAPAPQGTPCPDDDLCNGDERCDGAGICVAGAPPVVDDGNPCTLDACDPLVGVSHVPAAEGTARPDGDVCNGDELCGPVGECLPGTPPAVDDHNPCTVDACDPVVGVFHEPAAYGAPCPDADPCNGEEICDGAGTCSARLPASIDDGDPCTLDTCDSVEGIKHRACSKLDLTVATTLYEAAKFLFAGDDPIQKGVAPGTIDPLRISVLRGKVETADGAPLSGVSIRLLRRDPREPDYGSTVTQASGFFDLAINGGGPVIVLYEKPGYLSAQREIAAPRQDYAVLPEVVLLQPDPAVTAVELSGAQPLQVARGSVAQDADGQRQATVLLPAGTRAELVFPDGSTQPVSALHVRLTEYSVGPNGSQAMPRPLPPQSGYTYAVGLDADEALAAGASRIDFNPPAVFYV
ncbi:MAG: carboxypeptidase regulatory-like domain-containing protein, partial [Deltaproteobacteria bacterium]|nr:carboxypeptidase regulatory-like domain-containing protein [Deltaproteobacteria bacterium]